MRSISELAELVKSGQVQVPKGLDHYKKDRMQLLDQIFTILPPEDIKSMIPDILKVCCILCSCIYPSREPVPTFYL